MPTTVKSPKKAAAAKKSSTKKTAKPAAAVLRSRAGSRAKSGAKSAGSKSAVAKKTPSAKSQSSKSPSAKSTANGFHPGTYIVPRGHVSLAVPTFWNLRQTNDDVQVESEASETTVIVTAYHRNAGVPSLDARDYLQHFLETAPVAGRVQSGESSKQQASARFRDEEGDNWLVRFISNGATLLLATCHTNRPLTSRDGRTGVAVLDSIRLKSRG
jgi:hypothetical protein